MFLRTPSPTQACRLNEVAHFYNNNVGSISAYAAGMAKVSDSREGVYKDFISFGLKSRGGSDLAKTLILASSKAKFHLINVNLAWL